MLTTIVTITSTDGAATIAATTQAAATMDITPVVREAITIAAIATTIATRAVVREVTIVQTTAGLRNRSRTATLISQGRQGVSLRQRRTGATVM